MISLSEDEWALCEEYSDYITNKKVPPKPLREQYLKLMVKFDLPLRGYHRSDGKECDEDQHD